MSEERYETVGGGRVINSLCTQWYFRKREDGDLAEQCAAMGAESGAKRLNSTMGG